jgi:hypothetical protein
MTRPSRSLSVYARTCIAFLRDDGLIRRQKILALDMEAEK